MTKEGVFKILVKSGIFQKWEYFAYRINTNGITEVKWLPNQRESTFHNWKVGSIPEGAEIIQ